MKPKRRLALLLRVSSPQQAREDKVSLDVQEEELSRIGEALGFAVINPKRYKGVESASKGKVGGDRLRGILGRLLEDARRGEFDAVMVFDFTRWSRDTEEALAARRSLHESGTAFYVKELPVPFGVDPDADFYATLQHAMAQAETGRFKTRVRSGKLKGARNGRWTIAPVPYGLKLLDDRRTFTLHDERMAKLQKLYRMVVVEKASLPELEKELADGTQQAWQLRIKEKNAGKRISCTLNGETFFYDVPERLSEEERRQIIEMWRANRTRGERGKALPYALGGKLKCGNCGSILQGYSRRGRRDYHHQNKTWKDAKCIRSVEAQRADYLVFGILGKTLASRKDIRAAIEAGLDDRAVEAARVDAEVRAERTKRARLGQQEQAIASATQLAADERQRARLQAQLALVAEEINVSEARIAQLEQEKGSIDKRGDATERAAKFLEVAVGRWDTTVPELRYWKLAQKRDLMDVLFGDGSLRRKGQSAEQRMAVGVFISRRAASLYADIRTQVPLFDDATLQKLARRIDGKVLPSNTASACRPR